MKRKFTAWLLVIAMFLGLPSMTPGVAHAKNTTGNIILSIPWELINKCGHQAVSGPCQAYCWAYCRIILDNVSHTYRDYWTRYQGNDGKWHETATAPSAAGYTSQTTKMTSKQVLLKTICDNVDQGRPVVVRVKGSKAYHYVTAIGYRAGCDKSNLKESDILILDPASNTIQPAAKSTETYTYLSSRTLSLTNDGKYVCWTTGTNGTSTEMKPGSGNLEVQVGKPSKPAVSVSNSKVIVSWSYSGTSTNYDVYLVQKPWRWEDIQYHASTTSSSCVFESVVPGDYQAFVIVRPNKDTEQSEWTAFTVQPASITITFDANGGSVSQSSKSVTSGSEYGTLPTPSRNGYTFDGWYTSASGGSRVTSSTTFNGLSNLTLYAHWTVVSADIKITFDPNGGSTSQSSKTIKAGSYLAGLPTASREGFTFLGWSLDKMDPYAEGVYTTTIISENMYSFDRDTTLYAFWSPDKQVKPENCAHTKGILQYSDHTHPHYNYYSCSRCGESFTDYSTTVDTSCEHCWGPWSEWSTTPVYPSSTRQVETKSVQISYGGTEYRYGRYIDSTRGHICWCGTYLGSKGYSGITVQYSEWSTSRYGTNGKVWTCGYCSGNHTGIDHYDSEGRACWNEYSLSSGSYYWEESRQTGAVYETQYRYRDLIT